MAVGVLGDDLAGDDLRLGADGLKGGVGTEFADDAPEAGGAPFEHAGAVGLEVVERAGGDEAGDVEVGREAGERFRGDTDNGKGARVDADGAADDAWIGAKALRPARVRDHDDGGGADRLAVGGQEHAAVQGLDAEGGKRIGRDDFEPGALGRIGARREVRGHGRVGDERFETAEALAVVLKIGKRDTVRGVPGLTALEHEHEPVGLRHGHALKQKGAGDAEEGRVDGDAEGEGQHDHERVAGGSLALAEGVAEIGEHGRVKGEEGRVKIGATRFAGRSWDRRGWRGVRAPSRRGGRRASARRR